jgi:hypothetical protein
VEAKKLHSIIKRIDKPSSDEVHDSTNIPKTLTNKRFSTISCPKLGNEKNVNNDLRVNNRKCPTKSTLTKNKNMIETLYRAMQQRKKIV